MENDDNSLSGLLIGGVLIEDLEISPVPVESEEHPCAVGALGVLFGSLKRADDVIVGDIGVSFVNPMEHHNSHNRPPFMHCLLYIF